MQYLPPHPAHSVVGNRELYGELQDIVVRLNSNGTDLERVEFTMEDEGLGRLPHEVPSVGSLLLFNSNINPYKEYQTLDNLVSAGRYVLCVGISVGGLWCIFCLSTISRIII